MSTGYDRDNAGYDWENEGNNWYDDPNQVVDFVSWYYDGTSSARPSEIIGIFEKPWHWNNEYSCYLAEIEVSA